MNRRLEFFVAGRPVPKGSWKAVTPTYFKASSKGLKEWQQAVGFVALEARQERGIKRLEAGPVVVEAEFLLPKPKKPKCEECPCYEGTPDTDKLIRAILDSMESVIYRNDAQVLSPRGNKRWAEPGERPGVRITVVIEER